MYKLIFRRLLAHRLPPIRWSLRNSPVREQKKKKKIEKSGSLKKMIMNVQIISVISVDFLRWSSARLNHFPYVIIAQLLK